MSNYNIGSRYAKSLFQLAREKGKLDQVFEDVKLLNDTLKSSKDLRNALANPVIHSDKKLAIFKQLFFGKIDSITELFLTLLAKKGREPYLATMADSFVRQYNEAKNITVVKLVSATPMKKESVDELLGVIKQKDNLGELVLHQSVDPSLVGGFLLQYGDKQYDTTVLKSIRRLHKIVEDDSYVKKLR